jgi:hypothetical protein
MQETKFRFNPIELGHLPTATTGGTLRGCPGERAALHTSTTERLRGCLGERAALHTATAEWLWGWARAGRRGPGKKSNGIGVILNIKYST